MRQTPSQPSPFSPELQTFILTKFDPLLAIVRELNETSQRGEKDRARLEQRLRRLEDRIDRVQAGETTATVRGEDHRDEDDIIRELPPLGPSEQQQAPWLFSCQAGTPTASIQLLLEFSPETTEELDVRQWNSEEDMWVALLEDLPSDIAIARPDSFALKRLRESARVALIGICQSELLLILRHVPGKDEACLAHPFITFVAILSAALAEAWTRVERTESDKLGRIALVLEGNNIGTRLRAGRNKFMIEPLN